ncbi:MAG: RdgB/HAM1 family non-canonical purine NTP pyrophosphatase [Methylococcales bacterium]
MSTDKIVLASNNPGKIREIQAILDSYTIVPQSEFNIDEADETGLTFVENAIIKARNATQACGLPAIADDSGLEVDALNGAPGVFSARYAGVGASDKENLDKLLIDLRKTPDIERTARFRCVIAYLRHKDDPCPIIAEGSWEGLILRQPVGEAGFGYDPVFFVSNKGCSSAELIPEEKNRLSHRAQALLIFTTLFQT